MSNPLKPNKPPTFDGRRDSFVVNSWISQVTQYLTLVQVGSDPFSDDTKVNFASSFFIGTAATWWFSYVTQHNCIPNWDEFVNLIRLEFVPSDSNRSARNKLKCLYQRRSVAEYLGAFRDTALCIPGITDEEKLDRFTDGLKHDVRLEVNKAYPPTFEDAARIALNVYRAICGVRRGSQFWDGGQGSANGRGA